MEQNYSTSQMSGANSFRQGSHTPECLARQHFIRSPIIESGSHQSAQLASNSSPNNNHKQQQQQAEATTTSGLGVGRSSSRQSDITIDGPLEHGGGNVIRWSSVERNTSATPSDSAGRCLQVQPMQVRCTSDGQRVITEHGHRMLVDGDAYTLVILECSPHPDNEYANSASAGGGRTSGCDCCSRCFCQTELIVKQQLIPTDHVCQHFCRSHQQLEHQDQQQQQHRETTTSISTLNERREQPHQWQQQTRREEIEEEEIRRQQQRDTNTYRQYQQLDHSDFLDLNRRQRRPEEQRDEFQQSYSRQSDPQQAHHQHQPQQQPQQPQLHQQYQHQREQPRPLQSYYSQVDKTTHQVRIVEPQASPEPPRLATNRNYHQQDSSTQQQVPGNQFRAPQSVQSSQAEYANQRASPQQMSAPPAPPSPLPPPLPQTRPSPEVSRTSGQPGNGPNTRVVKRWDWNAAQFVESEVPDKPRPQPLPAESPARSQSSADVWHQEILTSISTPTPAGGASSSSGNQQPDPYEQQPWLAHRIPDVQSVQSDPLYVDLMLELKRLEEGVNAPISQVVIEPETFQRPVFGQPITPHSIEAKEYENVEFVCRLIPISDPSMSVEWTLNGKPLQESSRIEHEHEFGVVRLRIKRCEAEDSGVYQCRAKNSLGEISSGATLRVLAKGNVQCETLNPEGLEKIRQLENPKQVDEVVEQVAEAPPKFLTHIQDYVEKDEGDSVHFECCLGPVDDPDLKTEWLFNGRPLVTGSRFHTIDDFGFIVLDIDWLFPRDTGEYICRATNKHGTDLTRTVLRVKPAKNIILDSQLDNPTTIDKLRQLEFPDVVHEQPVVEPDRPAHFVQPLQSAADRRRFVEGDNVHFEARVGPATDGNLTVEWFHNDKPLISGHRFKPSFDFGHIQLDILYVYAEDSGIYRCVTRNATGQDVSEFEIFVLGKPSLVYQTQLPKEMEGGVQKITDMEAMWNRAPDPEEEAPPEERMAPQFVLKPKPYTAFEGSCARFCCRIVGNPRPRLTWVLNGQTVVSGSRFKLTHDGMYHLTIPKCQLTDAGKVEVYARNLLGDCFSATELKVQRKVDDYRGVLKNSPNPWYDEQSLKLYQRQRSHDFTDDEDFLSFQQLRQLQFATEQQSTSPFGNQLIGYMEPGTPDVNLLATRTQSPLIEPGDLHPVVAEQQVVMAPAPSTIQRALQSKSGQKPAGERPSFQSTIDMNSQRRLVQERSRAQPASSSGEAQDLSQQQRLSDSTQNRHVFGVDLPRSPSKLSTGGQVMSRKQTEASSSQQSSSQQRQRQQRQHSESQDQFRLSLQQQQQQREQQQQQMMEESSFGGAQRSIDSRLPPPPSPESVVHGKEVHSQTHKQTQLERRANQEIKREIIEKEIFEQEHKGITKENVVRGSSLDRGFSPSMEHQSSPGFQSNQTQQRQVHFQEQQQQQQQVLIEDYMIPPEFIQKIQPCQAIDGDEARFECTFKGDPKPSISWFRESKMIKPSNLYTITTDLEASKSTLVIKRVALNSNAVYTVKAENVAGSAKSSANLVVEPHPLPESKPRAGLARKVGTPTFGQSTSTSGESQLVAADHFQMSDEMSAGFEQQQQRTGSPSKMVRSVRTRKLSGDEMAALIRASPEGLVAPTFLHTIHDTSSRPGELARLDARLLGSQPMEVRWLRNGERVRADKSHKLLLEGDLYTLLILECSARDEGTYECVAANRVGEARCGASLTVSTNGSRSTPDLMTAYSTFSTSASSSSTTTTAASAAAASDSSATTLTAATGSSSSSATGLETNQQQQQRQHFGLAKHQPNTLMDQYTSQAQASQTRSIPKLIKRLESQQVREGKPVTLRCQISSHPPIAEVHWFKQGDKLIKPSKYFRIFKDNEETYCLKILEAFPEDQGEYKCVARAPNGQTQVETRASLTVIPNSPR